MNLSAIGRSLTVVTRRLQECSGKQFTFCDAVALCAYNQLEPLALAAAPFTASTTHKFLLSMSQRGLVHIRCSSHSVVTLAKLGTTVQFIKTRRQNSVQVLAAIALQRGSSPLHHVQPQHSNAGEIRNSSELPAGKTT